MRVLVVDDNHANREVARHVLLMHGHEVRTVDSGTAAVAARAVERFDLVLMDINMPRMCGLEAALRLRATENPGERTPIFALTAYSGSAERLRCRAVGLDAVLPKPLRLSVLETAIRQYVPAKTLDVMVFEVACQQHGADGAWRAYALTLLRTLQLEEQDGAEAARHLSGIAEGLGLMALSRRLLEAASVSPEWRGFALAAARRECAAAERFLRAASGAIPCPDKGALRA